MILKEFSKYIQQKNDDILSGKTTATKILTDWIRLVIHKNPKKHVDNIVHSEIMLAENSYGEFLLVGKSESGRILIKALYNYAQSYEQYIMSKWLQDKKASHFNK